MAFASWGGFPCPPLNSVGQTEGHNALGAPCRLTDDQRQVILLKFMEEMSNEETAQVMGKSVGAVKALQHRALAALQRVLQGET